MSPLWTFHGCVSSLGTTRTPVWVIGSRPSDNSRSTQEEGLAAVLAHKIGLLNTFVGEDLVLPLVQQAWGVIEAPRTEGEL
jgi:hypothetical protein